MWTQGKHLKWPGWELNLEPFHCEWTMLTTTALCCCTSKFYFIWQIDRLNCYLLTQFWNISPCQDHRRQFPQGRNFIFLSTLKPPRSHGFSWIEGLCWFQCGLTTQLLAVESIMHMDASGFGNHQALMALWEVKFLGFSTKILNLKKPFLDKRLCYTLG